MVVDIAQLKYHSIQQLTHAVVDQVILLKGFIDTERTSYVVSTITKKVIFEFLFAQTPDRPDVVLGKPSLVYGEIIQIVIDFLDD